MGAEVFLTILFIILCYEGVTCTLYLILQLVYYVLKGVKVNA